jgi:hypothetical protein
LPHWSPKDSHPKQPEEPDVHTARAEREIVAEFIAEAIVPPSPVTRDSLPLCSPVMGESPGPRPGVASRPTTARREEPAMGHKTTLMSRAGSKACPGQVARKESSRWRR